MRTITKWIWIWSLSKPFRKANRSWTSKMRSTNVGRIDKKQAATTFIGTLCSSGTAHTHVNKKNIHPTHIGTHWHTHTEFTNRSTKKTASQNERYIELITFFSFTLFYRQWVNLPFFMLISFYSVSCYTRLLLYVPHSFSV